jgi:hypothetical protein
MTEYEDKHLQYLMNTQTTAVNRALEMFEMLKSDDNTKLERLMMLQIIATCDLIVATLDTRTYIKKLKKKVGENVSPTGS